ncbi:MAG TPA: DNA mismatch repair endonuclease MutL [Bacteroidota bacterium]|nr:DNA mismatch repair endonuclease MutL [Bacteroidota bacterium]
MAATINILPSNVVDKIAAGEVVGRPASVVKELIENAIDAQSTSISIIIKDGGTSLIQVVDDGTGMSAEDARVAFERHATSKIRSYEDLESLHTLGFRGEALASIAAVSQVELRTRLRAESVGTKVRVNGGEVSKAEPEAVAVGTNISVRNLFFNTPARRNFLKSAQTEYKHIVETVQRAALASPTVAFTFISNGEQIFLLPSGTLEKRATDLLGEQVASRLIHVAEKIGYVEIGGFLGKPDFARKGRTEQYLFLNGRPIVNRNINHAVFQGYENMLEKGSFPIFVLFLTIDPHMVDVNVHPSKMEVKFDDESAMHRFVFTAVRNTLAAHDLIPSAATRESASEEADFRISTRPGVSAHRVTNWREFLQSHPDRLFSPSGDLPERARTSPAETARDTILPELRNLPEPQYAKAKLWQVHNKYIVVPTSEGLMIVDQHAAHERVLYERAEVRFHAGEHQTQQLLFPQSVDMTAADVALIHELLPHLEALGFGVKVFGKTTVIIDGVPTDVKPGNEGTILQDVVNLYKADEQEANLEPRERLAKSYSCKAAIKAGIPLKPDEMESLLDQLFQTELPYTCPHGRPVIINLSLSELDRRFGRTP